MASLPRNQPDALLRPGDPGRRSSGPARSSARWRTPTSSGATGRQPVTYPHPSLEPILERTLGVPIFQEQLLRIAMVAAGFTGGEAEELRRAMGFKRSVERMNSDRGAAARRDDRARHRSARRRTRSSRPITSFALYGFPESHAASFALIAYASAYLKAHHPTAFYLGAPQRLADGLLPPGDAGQGRAAPRRRGAAGRRPALGLEVPLGGARAPAR